MWWKYIRRGMAVAAVLLMEVPKAMQDGKVTVQEAVDILVACYQALDQPMHFDVPNEIKDVVIGFTGEVPPPTE